MAGERDAADVVRVRVAAARALTATFGTGPWSGESTERGMVSGLRDADIVLATRDDVAVGTFRLSTRKPWAIDRAYFTRATRPLYLTDMAVHPAAQRQGVGRALLAYVDTLARPYGADAIWLDAYDAAAGAGNFYAACGYRECGRRSYRDTPLVYFERRPIP